MGSLLEGNRTEQVSNHLSISGSQ